MVGTSGALAGRPRGRTWRSVAFPPVSAPIPRELADGKLLLDEPAGGSPADDIQSGQAQRARPPDPRRDHRHARGLAAAGSARCLMVTGAHGMFSAGYDIGEIPDEEFEERAERLVAHPFTERSMPWRRFPTRRSRYCPATRSGGAWSSRWPATCVLPGRDQAGDAPGEARASSTRTWACGASSTPSARHARASCFCSAATSTPHGAGVGAREPRRPPTSSTRSPWTWRPR